MLEKRLKPYNNKLTWNTAISLSKSSREGRFPGESSPSVGSIPGGRRKSQSETPITPRSGASGVGRMAWLGEWMREKELGIKSIGF